jgi:hypothetical protein
MKAGRSKKRLLHVLVARVLDLVQEALEPDAGHESREDAAAAHQVDGGRDRKRQRHRQRQRRDRLGDRLVVGPDERPAGEPADRDPDRRRPQHVPEQRDRQPVRRSLARRFAHQQDGSHHEQQREAVVGAAFGGNGVAQARRHVVLGGPAGNDRVGQHRIGRGENAADQQRRQQRHRQEQIRERAAGQKHINGSPRPRISARSRA